MLVSRPRPREAPAAHMSGLHKAPGALQGWKQRALIIRSRDYETRLPEEGRVPGLLGHHQLYPHTWAHTHKHTHSHRRSRQLVLKTDSSSRKRCSPHIGRLLKMCHFKDKSTLVKTNFQEEILWGSTLVKQPPSESSSEIYSGEGS